MDKYITSNYSCFKVHSIKDNYCFFHIEITDKKSFMEGICSFILDEINLLRYAKNKSSIEFQPSRLNYTLLYKQLYYFIDEENLVDIDIDDDIQEIIHEEFEAVTDESGTPCIRLNKIGRLGEYIFHILLSDFFTFDCILPKVRLSTDRNMSVFGIDELFLDKKKKMILFGESKVSKNIDNGIALINKSLSNYESDIRDEFMLVLSNNHLKLSGLDETYKGIQEICISFDEFIHEAKLNKIGVPIFIAHGQDLDLDKILGKLNSKINRYKYFGLDTIYYAISLPLICKDTFLKCITSKIKERMDDYNDKR